MLVLRRKRPAGLYTQILRALVAQGFNESVHQAIELRHHRLHDDLINQRVGRFVHSKILGRRPSRLRSHFDEPGPAAGIGDVDPLGVGCDVEK